jgi:hypothetical protein
MSLGPYPEVGHRWAFILGLLVFVLLARLIL